MKQKKVVMGLLITCLPFTVAAGTMGPVAGVDTWTNILTLSTGPVWASGGKFQTIPFSPELSRAYTAGKYTKLLAEGEVFLGRQGIINSRYEGDLGVAFAATSKQALSGDIWDFADPRFNNFFYYYHTKHYRVALKGKLKANNASHTIKPWISASLGWSSNKADHYREFPTICGAKALPTAFFRSHQSNALTYSVGAGVQRVLTKHWQVGLGYEFTDWGKSYLARASAQSLGSRGVTPGHFYTNGLLVNLTWLA